MSDDSLLQFPSDFPVKVMGRDHEAFRLAVTAIVTRHAPDAAAPAERPSRDGNYLALTFTIRATSQAQLDAIYGELSAHEDVMVAL